MVEEDAGVGTMIPNGRENTGYPTAHPDPYPEAYASMNNSNSAFPPAFPPAFAEPFPGSNKNAPGWVPPRRRNIIINEEDIEHIRPKTRKPISWAGIAFSLANSEPEPITESKTKQPSGSLVSIFGLFLDPNNLEAFLGDLYDKHALLSNNSQADADQWLRRQLLTSFLPLAWAQFKRTFGLTKLMEWYRR